VVSERWRRGGVWPVGLVGAVLVTTLVTTALLAPLSAAPLLGGTTHEVKRSETLSGIARQYGTTVREIVLANRLPSARVRLHPGSTLAIPDHKNGSSAQASLRRGPAKQAVKRASLRSTSVRDFFALPPSSLVLAIPAFDVAVPDFIWPVDGAVSSTFVRRGRGWHRGVDIVAVEGTPIYAAAPGVVIASGSEYRYGLVVKIEHEGPFITVYAHNLANNVEVGARVVAGQEIAKVGRSGHATNPHVHFEIRHEGRVVNPLYLLPLPPRVASEEFVVEGEEEDE
jgi:murein DD-endopeptidase MepM/ murein hydrolase activator NlpD